MRNENQMIKETIIKDRARVKQHGEVFTPRRTVRDMINLQGLEETITQLDKTVLEPACGEGIFLVEVLKKRLKNVWKNSNQDLILYENLALLSLTTLYGIELLEDNAQRCVINIYETFNNDYRRFASKVEGKLKRKVLESAKVIISANIVQGNFLTQKTTTEKPIVFSEWRIVDTKRKAKNIKVARTEFSLEEIIRQDFQQSGHIYKKQGQEKQLTMFDNLDMSFETGDNKPNEYKYTSVNISELYKKEMEEISG